MQLENPRKLEYTRAQLRQLPRERGIQEYYNLPKNELLQRLRAPGDQILDQDIDARMANEPFLMPTSYVPPTSNSNTITPFKRCRRFNRLLEQRKRNTRKRLF